MNIQHLSSSEYRLSNYQLNNIQENKYLIIDLEATGLNTKEDEVTEIAAMPIYKNNKLLEKPWSSLIKTEQIISPQIEKLTGIKNTDIKMADPFVKVFPAILRQYSDYVWVAQCGFEFDFPLLSQMYRKFFDKSLNIKILDTKVLYSYLNPKEHETFSTDFFIKRYNLSTTHLKRHTASADVEIVSDIFLNILNDYQKRKKNKLHITDVPLIIKKFIPKPIT